MSGNQPAGLTAFVREVFQCQEDVALSIAGVAIERAYRSGAVILRQDDSCTETYLLTLGRARAAAVGRGGEPILLRDFAPGDLFGATAQPEEKSEAEVVALEAARAAVFAALDFLRMMERHSCVGLTLSRMLLAQLRQTTERMIDRNTLSAVGRIHAELWRRAERTGWTISPSPVLAALALDLQTTRETVSRTVNALERRGVVRRTPDALIVVAPRRLEGMID
ncbi:hypothetical protein ASD38_04890 [Caulobacter sp. Root487D2Y]|uniref:Crp/Fnr family transcriptional regulator n=1 Tax=Caulobacter sp. Root487D2Y TaxID=1736547 RepID=UPI0006FE58CF|nr:Crp/Fnr family transcriptional regulator [Caulobacter sp. Root487D2Y]KQY35883.1 hypothetical protein ASD38_04890 [Caulobacter sp. Root487D2Y]